MNKFRDYIISHKNPIIASSISIIFALIIFAPNLFNQAIPSSGDVRAHIFKIDFLFSHLSHGQWPGWNPYWYDGVPMDPFYPPGFYFLGAILTFITRQALISYKLLMLLIMISNGLAIYYFARKFLKIRAPLAILCLIAFESSTALLMNYIYGTLPDLLGWTLCVIFLTNYLGNVIEDRIHRITDIVIPGLLFGITLMVHPFPAIFGILAIIAFHIVYSIHNIHRKISIQIHLRYFISVFAIGALISIYYWLPFLTVKDYVSPIYTSLANTWPSGVLFTIILIAFSLIMGLITRSKTMSDTRLDTLVVFIIIATALGFGLAQYLPFGLGSLVHGFRFATIMLPFFCILLIGYSINTLINNINLGKVYIAAMSLSLIIVSSIAPFTPAYISDNLNRLFSYVQNYRQPGYSQTLEAVENGRLVIPINRGNLSEGDSPVTFGRHYGVETVNGPYNQGDPKFFKDTVHLEWEERWLDNHNTRENLLQENAAKYVFVRDNNPSFGKSEGFTKFVSNSYGQLWALNEPVSRVVSITPVLLDVSNAERVTEFFNILLPQGYKIVFVNAENLSEEMKGKLDYVMTDNEEKNALYKGKTVFLLNNTDQTSVMVDPEEPGVIKLDLPYLNYTEKYFYRGDKGDVISWANFDFDANNHLSSESIQVLQQIGDNFNKYIQELKYEPVEYKSTENSIEIKADPGFTLIKDSYFPYWHPNQSTLLSTSQGFMLIYTNDTTATINYREPILNKLAAIISIGSLLAAITIAIFITIRTKGKDKKA